MPEEPSIPTAATGPGAGSDRGRAIGRRGIRRFGLVLLAALWAVTGAYYSTRPMPAGIRTSSPWEAVPPSDLGFLRDLTAADAYGRPFVDQQIFDRALAIIGHAQRFIVLDYFLFNERAAGGATPLRRPLSHELEAALVERMRERPGLEVLFITDPVNENYGSRPSASLERLRQAGVHVVLTALDRLPDPDPLYSAPWRLLIRWWDLKLPAALAPGLRATARRLNDKANERKLLIADGDDDQLVGLIGSADPEDAASADSNVALGLHGPALRPLLESELAIARAAEFRAPLPAVVAAAAAPERAPALMLTEHDVDSGRAVRVCVASEGAIGSALLERLGQASAPDAVDIAMRTLADREIVEALLAAAARGVRVHVLLDPNKDEYGEPRSGFPNRQVASELVAASDGAIKVRWYRTHGEQFHATLVAIYGPGSLWFTLGSANLTRHDLGDFDLEANAAVETARSTPLAGAVLGWFDTLWSNHAAAGVEYSAPYEVYADPSQGRYWLYRLVEGTGLANF
jgi:phosphatidylserine/phosphatidylglycerophosphate/cardiolipin synthase-like enzyme